MKRLLAVMPVLLVALTGAQQQQAWKPFTPPDKKFTVLLPGTPQSTTRKLMKGAYEIPTTIYLLGRPGANYLIAISDLPKEAPNSLSADLIKSAKEEFIKGVDGTWLGEKNALYNGLSGRLLAFKNKSGANGAVWMAAKDRKIYTLTIAKNKTPYAAEQAKFFGSFKVLP